MTRGRTLADLVAAEAPLPVRRATSVMVAVARALERERAVGLGGGPVTAEQVVLHEDGSVAVLGERAGPTDAGPDTEAGASIGRLLFELLTGRPPLGRDDAFEPVVADACSPAVCALLARSFSDAPGQWPDPATWRHALESEAGPMAPPPPPSVLAAARRRRLAVALGLVVLCAATVLVLLLAPGWWDAATEGATAQDWSQLSRTSS